MGINNPGIPVNNKSPNLTGISPNSTVTGSGGLPPISLNGNTSNSHKSTPTGSSNNLNMSKTKEDRIIIYYAAQFDALRLALNYPMKEYLRSLSCCNAFKSTGGKSKAEFLKSFDEVLVIKSI